jgi:hypothetical protein
MGKTQPKHTTRRPTVRTFSTGANRDLDETKFDYEGFLSPVAIEAFGAYMHRNRHLRDGSIRDSDNWQKGIPMPVYMKSAWRHFHDWWFRHRHQVPGDTYVIEHLCALIFNTQGYLHEIIKADPEAYNMFKLRMAQEASPKENGQ